MWNRRRLLKTTGSSLALIPFARTLSGCQNQGNLDQMNAEVSLGLYNPSDFSEPKDALMNGLTDVDFSWLSNGDSVLIKVASNSGRPHPATTSPEAIKGLVETLFAHGAGRVLVADQAGVQQVRLVEGDIRFRSTEEMFRRNGLLDATVDSGAEPYFFDDHGFNAGYFEATLPMGHHWQKPAMIPTIIRDVDHIVYAPRISSHTLSGYTHGHKLAIGWLRDDSRNHLHHDAATFYEKYTEVSYAAEIREKLRLTVSFCTSVLLNNGPDFGTVADLDQWLLLVSTNLAHHDTVSVGILNYFTQVTPSDPNGGAPEGPWANFFNFLFLNYVVPQATGMEWGPDGIVGYTHYLAHAWPHGVHWDRSLSRAYDIDGPIPEDIVLYLQGQEPGEELRKVLETHSNGILTLT